MDWYVWQDDVEHATACLSTPHQMLRGKTPLACADTEADTVLAEGVLTRLLYRVDGRPLFPTWRINDETEEAAARAGHGEGDRGAGPGGAHGVAAGNPPREARTRATGTPRLRSGA
ncbi:MAG: DUF2384 domain-containing protein [Gemmatimonadetes bacterium]|nr:DUF2384 domain-containing protein [Gemmatimonadota bacterium]